MTLNAMLALHCVSRSIAKTRHFLMTSAPARFIMVVVLPTPPLLFAIQMIRPGRRVGGEISVTFAVFLAAISTHPREVELSSLFMIRPPQVNYQVFSPMHTAPPNGGVCTPTDTTTFPQPSGPRTLFHLSRLWIVSSRRVGVHRACGAMPATQPLIHKVVFVVQYRREAGRTDFMT